MSSVSLELLVPIEVNAVGYQFHLELLKVSEDCCC